MTKKVLAKYGFSIVVVIVLLCLSFVALSSYSQRRHFEEIQQYKHDLSLAKSKWKNKQVSYYKIHVETFFFYLEQEFACSLLVSAITFQNEKPIYADPYETGCLSTYKNLSVEKIFERVERDLNKAELDVNISLGIKFDLEYGFITEYWYRYSDHEPLSIHVQNFTAFNK